jgi:hypothetical protein
LPFGTRDETIDLGGFEVDHGSGAVGSVKALHKAAVFDLDGTDYWKR